MSEGESYTPKEAELRDDPPRPCHQCNCQNWFDPDNDGLCDGFNNVGPTGNRYQRPIVSHF